MAISTLPFLINMVYSAFAGEQAGDNPWRALTPEWLTSSPPPVENWKGPAPLVTHPYGYGVAPEPQAVGASSS
jgi:cytochrome c oxidase subunit 1